MAKAKFGQMVELNQRMVDPDILGHAVRPHKVTVTLPSPKVFDLTPGKLRTIPPIVIGAGSLELERMNNFNGLVISALDDAFIGWRAEPAQSASRIRAWHRRRPSGDRGNAACSSS